MVLEYARTRSSQEVFAGFQQRFPDSAPPTKMTILSQFDFAAFGETIVRAGKWFTSYFLTVLGDDRKNDRPAQISVCQAL